MGISVAHIISYIGPLDPWMGMAKTGKGTSGEVSCTGRLLRILKATDSRDCMIYFEENRLAKEKTQTMRNVARAVGSTELLDGFTTLADERPDLHALHSDDLEARRVDTYGKGSTSFQLMIGLDIVHDDIFMISG